MKSLSYLVSILICLFVTNLNAQQNDAEIMVSSNKDTANIGEDIVYVVRLKNAGATKLTGVSIRVWVSSGLKYMSSTAPTGTTYNKTSQIWTLGTVPANQYYSTFYIRTQVTKDGVNSIYAEVMTTNEKDKDSTPGNNLFNEDDIDLKSVSTPMDFCFGEKINITAKGSLGFAVYQWYKDGVAIQDSTDRIFTITAPGSYRYTVNGSVLGNCQGELCAPIIVRYRSAATMKVVQPSAICGNTVIDLTNPNIVSATPAGGTFSYYNTLADAQKGSNAISLGLIKNTNTSKKVYVKYSLSGACAVVDTIRTSVNPTVTALAYAPKSVTCVSSSVALSSVGSSNGSDMTFKWSGPNNFSSTVTAPIVTAAGVYTLTVTNIKTGCFGVDTAVVKNNNSAVKVFAGNDTTIVKGKSVKLNAKVTGGVAPYKYMWLPPVGLSAANIANPISTPQATTTYNLIVTDANGCQGADLIKITVTGALANNTASRSLYTLICESGAGLPMLDLTMRLKGENEGGVWSVIEGNVNNQFDTTTGLFNPNSLLSGTYTFKYTIADSPNEIISVEEISIKIEQCSTKVTHPTTVIDNKK
jgi:uncharacterized repeat protein (TIGR01451 family)